MSALREFLVDVLGVKPELAALDEQAEAAGQEAAAAVELRAIVVNNTSVDLTNTHAQTLVGCRFERAPAETIPAGQTNEFTVSSDVQIFGGVAWKPQGDDGLDWITTFQFSPGSANGASQQDFRSSITSKRFIAEKPEFNGKDEVLFKLNEKGQPPQGFLSRVVVQNNADVALNKVDQIIAIGAFAQRPPDTIAAGAAAEFTIQSEKNPNDGSSDEMAAALVWEPDGAGQGERWTIDFERSSQDKAGRAQQQLISNRFVADDPVVNGNDFRFSLGKNQTPQLVGRVVVQNNADVALNKVDQIPAIGAFVKKPPDTIAAGAAAEFTIKSETNPNDGSDAFSAAVIWEPDGAGQGERWTIAFERNSQDKAGRGQQQLISTRFAADDPVVNGNDFRFTLNAEAAPEFKPPVAEKQPTLRLNDKSADGWVEYLQERLNLRLKPSPNLRVDGTYGPLTQKAVFAYQKQEGLQKDGTVGNQTWASLRLADPEAVGTDGREPHTFVDQGIKARWTSEAPETYSTSNDRMELEVVSVGDDTDLEGQKVSVFVTAPGSDRKGVFVKIGAPIRKTQTGQGDVHLVVLENFKKRFPSEPVDQDIKGYVVEAFFDQALGGDFYTSTKRGIVVVP